MLNEQIHKGGSELEKTFKNKVPFCHYLQTVLENQLFYIVYFLLFCLYILFCGEVTYSSYEAMKTVIFTQLII